MKGANTCDKLRGAGNSFDPEIPEWGNPIRVMSNYPIRRRTRGSETSQYPEEKKENSIPRVVASEKGGAQTDILVYRGCRTPIFELMHS